MDGWGGEVLVLAKRALARLQIPNRIFRQSRQAASPANNPRSADRADKSNLATPSDQSGLNLSSRRSVFNPAFAKFDQCHFENSPLVTSGEGCKSVKKGECFRRTKNIFWSAKLSKTVYRFANRNGGEMRITNRQDQINTLGVGGQAVSHKSTASHGSGWRRRQHRQTLLDCGDIDFGLCCFGFHVFYSFVVGFITFNCQ